MNLESRVSSQFDMFIFVLYDISDEVRTQTSSSHDSINVIVSISRDIFFLSDVNSINLGISSSDSILILFSRSISRDMKAMVINHIKNGLNINSAFLSIVVLIR